MFFDKKKIENFEIISFEYLIVEIENNHVAITLNRANKKNALNSKMIEELAICTDYANFNDSIRAVVYRSDGDTFCSGLDLNDFKDSKNSIQLADIFNKLHKPKLVVLEGNVYAGGVLIVACANHVISKKEIKLSLPEVKRGLFPFQVLAALVNKISKSNAINWCISGDTITAQKALEWGLLTEVLEGKDLTTATENIIEKIKGNSPNAIRLGLEAYERITKSDGEHQYLMEMLQKTIMSKDAQEGINAFKEKRNPVWTGE